VTFEESALRLIAWRDGSKKSSKKLAVTLREKNHSHEDFYSTESLEAVKKLFLTKRT